MQHAGVGIPHAVVRSKHSDARNIAKHIMFLAPGCSTLRAIFSVDMPALWFMCCNG